MYFFYASAEMTNVTISDNSAGDDGGGLYVAYSPPLPFLSYSNAWDNSPDDYSGIPDPTGTAGNISANPGFLAPIPGDFHLSTDSLLVDAGSPTMVDPDGSRSDIGAYGGPEADGWDRDNDGYPEWWQPGEYDYGTYPGEGWDCYDWSADMYPGNGC